MAPTTRKTPATPATPATSKSSSRRDGLVIRDQWAQKGERGGKRWLYRLWDARVRKYKSKAFDRHPEDDKHRERPGCKAGDDWALDERARLTIGLSSAGSLSLRQVTTAYA